MFSPRQQLIYHGDQRYSQIADAVNLDEVAVILPDRMLHSNRAELDGAQAFDLRDCSAQMPVENRRVIVVFESCLVDRRPIRNHYQSLAALRPGQRWTRGYSSASSRCVIFSSVGWECSSEHGPLAYRLYFRRFILNDVAMLDEDPF
jgi:hypothetical protein